MSTPPFCYFLYNNLWLRLYQAQYWKKVKDESE